MPIYEGIDLVVSVTATSAKVVGKNPNRTYLLLVNDGSNDIYIGRGGTGATANRGIRLNNGGGNYEINLTNPFHGEIHAVCAAGLTSTLLVQEN